MPALKDAFLLTGTKITKVGMGVGVVWVVGVGVGC